MFSTAMPIPSRSFLQPVAQRPTCLPLITLRWSLPVPSPSPLGDRALYLRPWGMGPTTTCVFLNGNRSTLAFGGVRLGNQKNLTATEYNIGNLPLTLGSPYYTTNGANAAFTVLGSTTCGNGLVLDPAAPCDINVQFAPNTLGQTTQQLTVNSNGYNGGSGAIASPILTLRGTGNPRPARSKTRFTMRPERRSPHSGCLFFGKFSAVPA